MVRGQRRGERCRPGGSGDISASRIAAAIALIDTVPGYGKTAQRLRQTRIVINPLLLDRAQVDWRGTLSLGPEVFAEEGDRGTVSLAGTLAHEAFHLAQFPLLKTVSFWAGVATKTNVMARYERPAYEAQSRFLTALAAAHPDLASLAEYERADASSSYNAEYGYFHPL